MWECVGYGRKNARDLRSGYIASWIKKSPDLQYSSTCKRYVVAVVKQPMVWTENFSQHPAKSQDLIRDHHVNIALSKHAMNHCAHFVRRIVFLRQMPGNQMLQTTTIEVLQNVCLLLIGQMSPLPADTRFEPGWVNRLSQHFGIVIELQNERVASAKRIDQMRC